MPASILQTQAAMKEQLTRSTKEGERMSAAISNRKAALERAKREAEQISKDAASLKNETKRCLWPFEIQTVECIQPGICRDVRVTALAGFHLCRL